MKYDTPWSSAGTIGVPTWLSRSQSELQSIRYETDEAKMALVLRCAQTNAREKSGAPLAAAVFHTDGELVAIGVDAPGISGHEMGSALILASNIIGTEKFRSERDWEMFSLAPPCLVCLGNIYSERPLRFVCAVSHDELLAALSLPNTPIPDPSWPEMLNRRGIAVQTAVARDEGSRVLRTAV